MSIEMIQDGTSTLSGPCQSAQSASPPFHAVFQAGLLFVLLLAGCAAPGQPLMVAAAPTPEAATTALLGPPPPLDGPEALGGVDVFRPLSDLPDALACLASGQPAYAVVQQNANVRTEPQVEACRVGRAPAGTLLRVEGVHRSGDMTPLASLDRTQLTQDPPLVGYEEDIQPLFERVCSACHGDLLQNAELKVTQYDALMAGSQNGPVVIPGDPAASFLWTQISTGVMPLVGELAPEQKRLIYDWIRSGASEKRPDMPQPDDLWLRVDGVDVNPVANECGVDLKTAQPFLNSSLVRFATCAAAPGADALVQYLPRQQAPAQAQNNLDADAAEPQVRAEARPPEASSVSRQAAPQSRPGVNVARIGITAAPLGLPSPSDSDPWMVPQGGFCMEQRLQSTLENRRGITSMAFAPDGRLFLGLDAPTVGEQDPNILFDAYHPSRSIGVYNTTGDGGLYEILTESSRITGMVWRDGVLYLNRAGEVGRIVDGGVYEPLAVGFAVNGRLFHANNGIALVDGWLYISAGGVRDGYSDGVIAPGDGDIPAETLSVNIAGGGNPYAARLVRARLERLLSERSIGVFQTAARGLRNPYGLTSDPAGRLWFTDNGATNVAGDYTAGDEVDLFDPATLSPQAAAGDESATPYYGFPMALAGIHKDWWTDPVLPLLNTAAPTGIAWAYGTIFFAQYGRDPGLYRMARQGGQLIAERVLLAWPIQALATAPDGALWIGTGGGGLYRLTTGC